MLRALGLFFILFLSGFSKAEYRVFILEISGPAVNGEITDIQFIKSTLDPYQYSNVYPLKTGQSIRYVDTWRCKNHHEAFDSLCEKPGTIERAPATRPN